MFCENCGAKLEDDAQFCMSCGHKTENKEHELAIRKYQIICAALAAVCVALVVALVVCINRRGQSGGQAASQKMTLCGIYFVGEDEELPPGRYNITPLKGERYVDITIYPTKESYEKEKTTGDWASDSETLYEKRVNGYKLREGNVLKIYDPGAQFVINK